MTCLRTHSLRSWAPLGGVDSPRSGLHPASPPCLPSTPVGKTGQVLSRGAQPHLPADPPAEAGGTCHSHLPRPEVTMVAGLLDGAACHQLCRALRPRSSTLTGTLRFSAEVKVLGLEGTDKLTILRGCPGLPGAPGPKGEAGDRGGRGGCSA